MKRLYFSTSSYSCDDFEFISANRLAMVNAYWQDGLVKIYDYREKKITTRTGEPHIIELMKKFNINKASLCRLDGKLYAVESISPGIRVISPDGRKAAAVIKLFPPFYVGLED